MNNLQEIINNFLNTFCTKVQENDNTELLMDGAICIEYENAEWYVPKNNMLYTEDDELLVELLINTYRL